MSRSIATELAEIQRRLAALPEAEEPPPTTLQVLGRSTQERDWQQFLVHFLTPDAPHGLGYAVLEHVLDALSDRDESGYAFSRFDIDEIQIEQEVSTSDGIPDIVMWASEKWFICWELKVHASEGQDQTDRYVGVNSFDGIGLDKADVPIDGQHYVFLTPESASSPATDEFVHVSWEWLAAELQSFLMESYDQYPARTTAQLKDFIDTIRSELTMTEYEENQQEMVELYVENYGVISDLETAFKKEWSEFESTWGDRLTQSLEGTERIEDVDVPEDYTAVRVEMKSGERRQWTFRQGKSDWSWLFPRDWWTKLDESRRVSDATKPNARVGLVHRLDWHQTEAVRDHTLVVCLRNAPSGHNSFYNNFAARFSDASAEITETIDGTKFTITGNKSNLLRAEYPINVDAHADFFDAYVDALAQAVREGAVENPELVERIDRLYEATVAEDVSV